MGWVWSQRGSVYLLGVVCLAVATLAYTAGHVAPFWMRQDGDQALARTSLNIGIWFQCRLGGSCQKHQFSSDDEYLKTTRILQILGLLGLVVSVAIAIFANCRRHHPGPSFILEAVITTSAQLGLSGSMVYLGFTREDVETSGFLRYHWAFAVNVAASILALLAAGLILISNILSRKNEDGKEQSGLASACVQEQAFDNQRPLTTGAYNGGGGLPGPSQVYLGNDPAVFYPGDPGVEDGLYQYRGGPALRGGNGADLTHVFNDPPQARKDRYRRPHDEQRPRVFQLDGAGPAGSPQRPVHNRPPVPYGVMDMSSFMLPRVVVRGHYEPGFGYPEHVRL